MSNLALLLIKEEDRAEFNVIIESYKRHFSIEFSVLSVTENAITIKVSQGKCSRGIYETESQLSALTKKFILDFVGDGFKVHTRVQHYDPNHPNIVTAEWLDAQITESGLTLVQIGRATKIHPDNLSSYRSGALPMTNVLKGAVFHYFNALRLAAELAKAKAKND